MSLYSAALPQLTKMLNNLDAMLGDAVQSAEERDFDVANLLDSRLAPDMFTLRRQIQSSCDIAKFAGARIAGKKAARHEDGEQTMEELRNRIHEVLDFLSTITAEDFSGSKDRVIALPFMPGKGMSASNYFNEFALPNFYFHVTAAYAILRHNGVKLGKRRFLGSLELVEVG